VGGKNTRPVPVLIQIGYGCHPWVKNRLRTHTRIVIPSCACASLRQSQKHGREVCQQRPRRRHVPPVPGLRRPRNTVREEHSKQTLAKSKFQIQICLKFSNLVKFYFVKKLQFLLCKWIHLKIYSILEDLSNKYFLRIY
jgi:hypothetical protein